MTALRNGANWRRHDEEFLTSRCQWLPIGNDKEQQALKGVFFYAIGSLFVSNKTDNPPYPASVLRNWFGENAAPIEGRGLNVLEFNRDEQFVRLGFGPSFSVLVVVDPSYDINLQEEGQLTELETMTLPLAQTSTDDGHTYYAFRIPRVLMRDFVFGIMRMGGAELHCNYAKLEAAVERLLRK